MNMKLRGKKRMKGQYFLLGAILLCSLFFMGLPPGQQVFEAPSQDLDYVLGNLEREIPHVLNLGLDDGSPRTVMENFTSWTRDMTKEFLIDLSSFWLFAEGDPSTGNVIVSVGNYLGSDVTIALDLDGDQRNLIVQDGDSDSTTFVSVAPTYQLSVRFGSEYRNFGWNRDKVNLFALIELERSGNIARKDVVA